MDGGETARSMSGQKGKGKKKFKRPEKGEL